MSKKSSWKAPSLMVRLVESGNTGCRPGWGLPGSGSDLSDKTGSGSGSDLQKFVKERQKR